MTVTQPPPPPTGTYTPPQGSYTARIAAGARECLAVNVAALDDVDDEQHERHAEAFDHVHASATLETEKWSFSTLVVRPETGGEIDVLRP